MLKCSYTVVAARTGVGKAKEGYIFLFCPSKHICKCSNSKCCSLFNRSSVLDGFTSSYLLKTLGNIILSVSLVQNALAGRGTSRFGSHVATVNESHRPLLPDL